jgi:antitoxin component HigA of HigAB toxin-antitoxin module
MVEGEDMDGHIERVEDYLDHDPEPHEIEELCFLIVQEFVINSEEKQELHRDLLGLQEQVVVAFGYYTNERTFEDAPATVKLLGRLLPLIDRAAESARFAAETTAELLLQLREGIVALRDVLAQARDK